MSIVFKSLSNAPSMQRHQNCQTCGSANNPLPPDLAFKVNFEQLSTRGYQYLNELMNQEVQVKLNCRVCMHSENRKLIKAESNVKLFKHIYLDNSGFSNKRKKFSLVSIPKIIKILEQEFVICGIISFCSDHYKSYCYIINTWYEFNDLLSSPSKISNEKNVTIQPHFLLYISNSILN